MEADLMNLTRKLSAKTSQMAPQDNKEAQKGKKMTLKMEHFDPPSSNKVNLFKQVVLFDSYEDIYAEIIHINDTTRGSVEYFRDVVNFVRRKSYGDLFGIGMKLPRD